MMFLKIHLTTTVLMLLLPANEAVAGPILQRRGPCDGLKPTQTVSEERKASLDIAFRAALQGGNASGGAQSSVETVVLQDNALAQAYFTYQACLLKESGTIDQATAQEIVRKLMGLDASPTPTPATPPPSEAKNSEQQVVREGPAGKGRLRVVAPGGNGAVVLVDGEAVGKIRRGLLETPLSAGPHNISFKGAFLRMSSRGTPPQQVQVAPDGTTEFSAATVRTSKWWLWVLLGVVAVVAVSVALSAAMSGGGSGGSTYSSSYY